MTELLVCRGNLKFFVFMAHFMSICNDEIEISEFGRHYPDGGAHALSFGTRGRLKRKK